MPKEFIIESHGPYKWFGEGQDAIFSSDVASKHGVYFFAAPYKESFLVEYVGMTKKSFTSRMLSHLQSYFIGEYPIQDVGSYLKGRAKSLFTGKYGTPKEGRAAVHQEFFANFERYHSEIYKNLAAMRLFLFPIDAERRIVERIESEIALHLQRQKAPVGTFFDSGVRYRPRRTDEPPIVLKIKNNHRILGLPDTLEV
jgi:hypothetical protein